MEGSRVGIFTGKKMYLMSLNIWATSLSSTMTEMLKYLEK